MANDTTELERVLISSYKEGMISYLNSHPGAYVEAVKLACSDKQPYSWRAAWLLWSCMEENDGRIKGYVKNIIRSMTGKNDGHQRELLKILSKMKLNDEQEGFLFDVCMTTWEQINKQPSVRYTAFKVIVKLAKKHPDLSNVIEYLTQDQYLDSLSPGVKKSIAKIITEFNRR